MDFWELTKLLFRRWYFAVPMLLISVAATLLAGASVKPDYNAKLHLQLIPPLAAPEVGKPHNPWIDLGVGSVGNAAIIAVGDKAVLDGLVEQGYTDNIVVTMDVRAPIITVEAVGRSPKQAIDSAHAMAEIVTQKVYALQKSYGAPQGQLVTTRNLDTGDNVQTVTSKVKRALAVIGGVGVLLTSAVTIGLDALLRNRARRRAARAAYADPTKSDADSTVAGGKAAVGNPGDPVPVAGRHMTSSGASPGTAPVYRADSWAPAPSDPRPEVEEQLPRPEAEAQLGMPDDATIVLPMPHKEEWAAQGRASKRR